MRIHILGICGTFMAGLAVLAKQLGHEVSGSDHNVYPPMSDQLLAQGIVLHQGYTAEVFKNAPDCVIVGNAISRGNPAFEYLLNHGVPYISGPQWLAENVLQQRWVLAVAGTHGKTTTTSMLAWILEFAGLQPGFLIGGIPENFGISARLGAAPFFVIEADEYDSALFDKRSKFIHYHPRTLILNNLEFDHADIFPNLDAIKTQFHHLLRTIPSQGLIIKPAHDSHIDDVINRGCWTPIQTISATSSADWHAQLHQSDGSTFQVFHKGQLQGEIKWPLLGLHNIHNALAAIAAAQHIGVAPQLACAALSAFKNVKRRLEIKAQFNGITIYDDFAHHPTAIATTLHGLRQHVGNNARIIVVIELASNTMRSGVHKETLPDAFAEADQVLVARPKIDQDWGVTEVAKAIKAPTQIYDNVDNIILALTASAQSGDHIVIMSNAGFDNIHNKLLTTFAAT